MEMLRRVLGPGTLATCWPSNAGGRRERDALLGVRGQSPACQAGTGDCDPGCGGFFQAAIQHPRSGGSASGRRGTHVQDIAAAEARPVARPRRLELDPAGFLKSGSLWPVIKRTAAALAVF